MAKKHFAMRIEVSRMSYRSCFVASRTSCSVAIEAICAKPRAQSCRRCSRAEGVGGLAPSANQRAWEANGFPNVVSSSKQNRWDSLAIAVRKYCLPSKRYVFLLLMRTVCDMTDFC